MVVIELECYGEGVGSNVLSKLKSRLVFLICFGRVKKKNESCKHVGTYSTTKNESECLVNHT